ncbi:ATPdependent RNA helicase, partial [Podochytrium sp. JEL0797]
MCAITYLWLPLLLSPSISASGGPPPEAQSLTTSAPATSTSTIPNGTNNGGNANTSFFMPDESGPHAATWMAYGATAEAWGTTGIYGLSRSIARKDLIRIAANIARFEPVKMLVSNTDDQTQAQQDLASIQTETVTTATGHTLPPIQPANIQFLLHPIDDLWMRDTGPIFVHTVLPNATINTTSLNAVNLNFNGWGQTDTGAPGWTADPNKAANGIQSQPIAEDQTVAAFVGGQAGAGMVETWLVMEGGGIEVDGRGTAICTESAILNPNRNPNRTKPQVEAELLRLFGVRKVIWLPGLKAQDITDGHVDFYSRFVGPAKVVYAFDSDPASPDFAPTQQNKAILESATDADGNAITAIALNAPNFSLIQTAFDSRNGKNKGNSFFNTKGFAAGYVGYYSAQEYILMAQFGDAAADQAAFNTIQGAFPNKTVMQITTDGPGTSLPDRADADETPLVLSSVADTSPLASQRKRLPIFAVRSQLLFLVEKYPAVVVVGATGCGKTTQLPQFLWEEKWGSKGIIACSQPRRIAVTSIAARVAEEIGVPLGKEVGYAVRFDEATSEFTKIKYLTDGLLFREALLDPLLSKYSVVMIDEAHERSLYTDIMLGILKKIMKKRPELRVIISSATLDAGIFRDFFNLNTTEDASKDTSVIVSIEGRTFPVDIQFLQQPCADYVTESVEVALRIHKQESEGDILIFLTGKEEVETAVSLINEMAKSTKTTARTLRAIPLHGHLSLTDQSLAFDPFPPPLRKVIVSTNIAEASVTLPGVKHVIDSGLVKLKAYNPTLGLETLIIVPVSKAGAIQRAGRAGRVGPGKCFRLYTEETYHGLRETGVPEMQRSNLVGVVLQLKAMGIENVLRFDFLASPAAESLGKALELLYSLKAVDDYGRLTMPFGVQLAEFPLDPPLAAMLLNSDGFMCSEEALSIAAVLTVQNVFVSPSNMRLDAEEERRKFSVEEGDHVTY